MARLQDIRISPITQKQHKLWTVDSNCEVSAMAFNYNGRIESPAYNRGK